VVDVRMGSQHPVDFAGCHRDGLVLVDILALLHAAVDQEPTARGFQQRTAAGDLMVRAQKRDFHPKTPPVIQANFSGRPAVSTQMPRAIPSPSLLPAAAGSLPSRSFALETAGQPYQAAPFYSVLSV